MKAGVALSLRVYKTANIVPSSPLICSSVFWVLLMSTIVFGKLYYIRNLWLTFLLEQESLTQYPSLHSHHAGLALEWKEGQREMRSCSVTILYLFSKELLSEKCIWLPFPVELCLFEMFKKSIDPTSNRLDFAGCVKAQTSFCVTPKSGLHKHPVPSSFTRGLLPGHCSFVLSQVSGWERRQ